ncbi:hypothetical protein GCM10028795_12860 [Lysobacter olei]
MGVWEAEGGAAGPGRAGRTPIVPSPGGCVALGAIQLRRINVLRAAAKVKRASGLGGVAEKRAMGARNPTHNLKP